MPDFASLGRIGLTLIQTWIFVLRSVGAFAVLFIGLLLCGVVNDRRCFLLSKVGVATAANRRVVGDGDRIFLPAEFCLGDPPPAIAVEPVEIFRESVRGEVGMLATAIWFGYYCSLILYISECFREVLCFHWKGSNASSTVNCTLYFGKIDQERLAMKTERENEPLLVM
jgi:hypothetical protein